MQKDDYSLRFFNSRISPEKKRLTIFFAFLLAGILLLQCFYWLFANKAFPIICGLPFSMFFVTTTIIVEFIILLIMEKMLFAKEEGEKE